MQSILLNVHTYHGHFLRRNQIWLEETVVRSCPLDRHLSFGSIMPTCRTHTSVVHGLLYDRTLTKLVDYRIVRRFLGLINVKKWLFDLYLLRNHPILHRLVVRHHRPYFSSHQLLNPNVVLDYASGELWGFALHLLCFMESFLIFIVKV